MSMIDDFCHGFKSGEEKYNKEDIQNMYELKIWPLQIDAAISDG